jgi:ribosomal RNA-processing protein 12
MEVFELVVMLLKDKKSELYKAVINYSKKWLLKLDKSEQMTILPGLIKELFSVDEASKSEERSILKHFLLRVVKKHSREIVEKMIPADDRKILSNAIKIENRIKKKKR